LGRLLVLRRGALTDGTFSGAFASQATAFTLQGKGGTLLPPLCSLLRFWGNTHLEMGRAAPAAPA